jgi:predicted PurR-regulated permease PerM
MVILALTGLIVLKLKMFIPGILGAITLYILSRDLFFYFTVQKRWRADIVSLMLIAVFFIIIGIPTYLVIQLLSGRINYVLNHSQEILTVLQSVSIKVKEWTGSEILSTQYAGKIKDWIAGSILEILNSTFMIVSNYLTMYLLLYYMLMNAKYMEKSLRQMVPLKQESINMIEFETVHMVKANAIGIPLVGLVQGLGAAIGYWIFGVENVFMWAFLSGVFSMIPFVGPAVVWLPLSIWLFSTINPGQGIGLVIYSLVVTANVDNLARMTILKKIGDVHPVITVLGIIVGLNLFGFWGLIFGPLLISYLLLLIKIYRNEFIMVQNTGKTDS